jgi:hypothetical protein
LTGFSFVSCNLFFGNRLRRVVFPMDRLWERNEDRELYPPMRASSTCEKGPDGTGALSGNTARSRPQNFYG